MKSSYVLGLAGAAAVGLYVFRDRFGLAGLFGARAGAPANPQGSLTSTSPATTASSPIFAAAPVYQSAVRGSAAAVSRVNAGNAVAAAAAAIKTSPVASPPPPAGSRPGSGIGAKDITSAAAGIAAAAGCNAIPGVGTAASPLCGIAGAALGSAAYDYGSQAVGAIKGWFS